MPLRPGTPSARSSFRTTRRAKRRQWSSARNRAAESRCLTSMCSECRRVRTPPRADAGHPTRSTSLPDTRTRPSPALLLPCARHQPRPRRPDPRTPPRAAPHRATPRSSAPQSFPTSRPGTTTLPRRERSHRRPPPPHRRAMPHSSARRSSARMEWRARTRPTPRMVTGRALAAAGAPARLTAAGSPPTTLTLTITITITITITLTLTLTLTLTRQPTDRAAELTSAPCSHVQMQSSSALPMGTHHAASAVGTPEAEPRRTGGHAAQMSSNLPWGDSFTSARLPHAVAAAAAAAAG